MTMRISSAKTVKELISILEKCNPEATVIVSEKPGRGAASCVVYQGYADKWGETLSPDQDEEYATPAIEITADL